MNGIQEAVGSIPTSSTNAIHALCFSLRLDILLGRVLAILLNLAVELRSLIARSRRFQQNCAIQTICSRAMLESETGLVARSAMRKGLQRTRSEQKFKEKYYGRTSIIRT